MKRGRFTEEQIIGVLREQEAGMKVAEVCRKHGIAEPTFYAWKAKYSVVLEFPHMRGNKEGVHAEVVLLSFTRRVEVSIEDNLVATGRNSLQMKTFENQLRL